MTDKEPEEALEQQVSLEEEASIQRSTKSEEIPFSEETAQSSTSSNRNVEKQKLEEPSVTTSLLGVKEQNLADDPPEKQSLEDSSTQHNPNNSEEIPFSEEDAKTASRPKEQNINSATVLKASSVDEHSPTNQADDLPEKQDLENPLAEPNPNDSEEVPFSEDTASLTNLQERFSKEEPQETLNETPKTVEMKETTPETSKEDISDNKHQADEQAKMANVSVDFDLMNTEGRWLLKVISGPNIGAEFAMHADTSYVIGMDAKACDIIFQDMSVSRKHAKITIDEEEHVTLEDLKSKNGTFANGEKVDRIDVLGNTVVHMGTTTFLLLDREAEQTTIVAKKIPEAAEPQPINEPPKLPPQPQPDLASIQSAVMAPMQSEVAKVKQGEQQEVKNTHAISSLVILAIVTGLLMIVGVSATFLFRTEEITAPVSVNPDAEITKSLSPFPTIRFSYNPVNHRLLLVGHLLTITDRSKMLDKLQPLTFISDIDYNNVIIDELVWRDFNQTLAKNPNWKSITVTSPSAGHFVVSGFLQTKNQSSELSDYISQNFPYIDLLEKKIIVEEDLLNQINRELTEAGFRAVSATISGGDLTLSGSIPQGSQTQFAKICAVFKSVPGVRSIQILVSEAGQKEAMIDLTDRYSVSGFSKRGIQRSVVIGGKFLSPGDSLDGMYISSITDTTIYLEKDGVKYKIDFNR